VQIPEKLHSIYDNAEVGCRLLWAMRFAKSEPGEKSIYFEPRCDIKTTKKSEALEERVTESELNEPPPANKLSVIAGIVVMAVAFAISCYAEVSFAIAAFRQIGLSLGIVLLFLAIGAVIVAAIVAWMVHEYTSFLRRHNEETSE
jgi:hypothetical protein